METKINLDLKAAIVRNFGSQANFAQEIDVDESMVSRVIRGRKKLTRDEKAKWCERLSCETAQVFNS